jgi:hypothetical protein
MWHSEIAGKNTVFLDVGIPFHFDDFGFNPLPLEIRIDYMLPFTVPLSAGIYLSTPYPNLKTFGVRTAYHFNINNPNTDIYIVYCFNFGFLRNNTLMRYNDTPVDVRYFDFRAGVRYFFGKLGSFGLAVETGFKFQSVIALITIKIL